MTKSKTFFAEIRLSFVIRKTVGLRTGYFAKIAGGFSKAKNVLIVTKLALTISGQFAHPL